MRVKTVHEDNGPRTHEPNLRELTAELDGLRTLMNARLGAFEKLMDERNDWYGERDKDRQISVDKALTAAKELSSQASTASKEAVTKNETAQHEYNLRSNEFRGQLDDQAKRLIARTEVEALLKAMQERFEASIRNLEDKNSINDREIRTVRENVGLTGGKSAGVEAMWNKIVQVLTLLGGIGGGVVITKIVGH